MERLQKLLARAGIASRRAAEKLIVDGRVTVDGAVVDVLGARADAATQEIAVDGEPIRMPDQTYLLVLNKPAGVLSTRADDRGRGTVMQFVPEHLRSLVYPVGRLDLDSTGLLLLTNDGPLAFRLIHPSFHVPKRYVVNVARPPDESQIDKLRHGVEIEDGRTAPAEVERNGTDPCCLTIVLYEGRKRQIRRMLRAVGNEVVALKRVSFGPLELGDLPSGKVRELTADEARALREAVGLDK